MITKKYIFISTAVLASSLWATASFAQDTVVDIGSDLSAEAAGTVTSENALDAVTGASDNLLLRALAALDELPLEARADIASLQESLLKIRTAWETRYDPGAGATSEQILAAREQLALDFAAEISAAAELRAQLVTELRDQARESSGGGQVSEEAQLKAAAYKELGLQISAAWRQERATLGADATVEEIDAARAAFLEANAELLAERESVAAEMRALAGASVERPVVDRGEIPAAVQALKADLELARADLRERRQEAVAEFKDLTSEEREIRRQALVEELRAANDEMKERRRQLARELSAEQAGDRRVED